MIKEAYIRGFINKCAASGISWSDFVSIPSLQKYFETLFTYPKIEPGKKAITDYRRRIVSAKDIADSVPNDPTDIKDVLYKIEEGKLEPKTVGHSVYMGKLPDRLSDIHGQERKDLVSRARKYVYGY